MGHHTGRIIYLILTIFAACSAVSQVSIRDDEVQNLPGLSASNKSQSVIIPHLASTSTEKKEGTETKNESSAAGGNLSADTGMGSLQTSAPSLIIPSPSGNVQVRLPLGNGTIKLTITPQVLEGSSSTSIKLNGSPFDNSATLASGTRSTNVTTAQDAVKTSSTLLASDHDLILVQPEGNTIGNITGVQLQTTVSVNGITMPPKISANSTKELILPVNTDATPVNFHRLQLVIDAQTPVSSSTGTANNELLNNTLSAGDLMTNPTFTEPPSAATTGLPMSSTINVNGTVGEVLSSGDQIEPVLPTTTSMIAHIDANDMFVGKPAFLVQPLPLKENQSTVQVLNIQLQQSPVPEQLDNSTVFGSGNAVFPPTNISAAHLGAATVTAVITLGSQLPAVATVTNISESEVKGFSGLNSTADSELRIMGASTNDAADNQTVAFFAPIPEEGIDTVTESAVFEVVPDVADNNALVEGAIKEARALKGAGNQQDGVQFAANFKVLTKPSVQNPSVWSALDDLRGRERMDVTSIQQILSAAVPGQDYPNLVTIPDTSFSCERVNQPGFYADADPSSRCQVIRRCDANSIQWSYLCPNATLFNQITLTCDWFFNVDCSKSVNYYDYSNSRLYNAAWIFLDTSKV
ncbi:uncharacterized protein LOC129602767 [Paramacrobiotus metropolitanus]|uniref:uncharacterized protein LOC129602767 n=1 Tax=Paramacrobiotus metropolitanus TaxID=2943436 RepID=UPI002445DE3B|nr:uncharacterized protein LOC129602767 [Paramacrobiotus metropolitanus]